MKIFILFCVLIIICAHASETRVSGEYILTTKIDYTEKDIESLFKEKPEVKILFKNHYLLKFKQDPGLTSLEKNLANKDIKIQPNFKYNILPKPGSNLPQ